MRRPKSYIPDSAPPAAVAAGKLVQRLRFTNARGEAIAFHDTFKGGSAFLICGGPSVSSLDFRLLDQPGLLVAAINNAAVTYRPDLWIHGDNPDHFARSIYLDPAITKFTPQSYRQARIFNSKSWSYTSQKVSECQNQFFYELGTGFDAAAWLSSPRVVWGNNGDTRSTMFAAIRILYELGIKTIYLLGADFKMDRDRPYHFDEHKPDGAVRSNNGAYTTLSKRFAELRPHFERAGLRIINCNPNSALKVFPFMPFPEAIRQALSGFPDVATEPTNGLYNAPKSSPAPLTGMKWSQDPSDGPCIVTGSDKAQQDLLPFWYWNLRRHHPDVPVVFADFGMDAKWVEWCKDRGDVIRVESVPGRTWFKKPFAILSAQYKRIAWIDADVEVRGDLSPLWTTYMPASGVAMAADPPALGHPGCGNSGVVVVNHGDPIVEQWASRCLDPHTRGDQEELFAMGVRGGAIPQPFNWLRLLPVAGRESAAAIHWTGINGKRYIRETMKRLGMSADRCDPRVTYNGAFDGATMWRELHEHTPGTSTVRFIEGFIKKIPCGFCRDDFAKWVASHPAPLDSNLSYFAWTVEAHNFVNGKLGKPTLSVSQASEVWQSVTRQVA